MKDIQKTRKVGVDLAKNVIQIYAVDEGGQMVMSRRLSRAKALAFFEQLDECEIGMEACSGAHHWGRICQGFGHRVKMMPAQYVKPFVKTNKNDATDAQAVYEAMCRPTMRFVQVKGTDQQTVLLAHRVREQLVKQHTQTINELRSHCAEFGVVCPKGGWNEKNLVDLIESGEESMIPEHAYSILKLLSGRLGEIGESIAAAEAEIEAYFEADAT